MGREFEDMAKSCMNLLGGLKGSIEILPLISTIHL
jgi:hypothetical protein